MNNDPVRIAVNRVFEMRKNNPTWSFSFIVGKVADWHKISFNVIMERVMIMNRKRTKKKIAPINGNKKPKVIDRGEDGYPKNAPWWVKN